MSDSHHGAPDIESWVIPTGAAAHPQNVLLLYNHSCGTVSSCSYRLKGKRVVRLLTDKVLIIKAQKIVDWALQALEFLRFVSDATFSESWAL